MKNINTYLQSDNAVFEAAQGPYTIAWGGGSIGENSKFSGSWAFKGANYRLRYLDWAFESEAKAQEHIDAMDPHLKGATPYELTCEDGKLWTIVSDDKELMKNYNKKFNRKYSGGYYGYTYGVVSLTGATYHKR